MTDDAKDEIHVSEMMNHEVGQITDWSSPGYTGRVVRREGDELKEVKAAKGWGKTWKDDGSCVLNKEKHPKCKVHLIEKSPERKAEVKTKQVGRETRVVVNTNIL